MRHDWITVTAVRQAAVRHDWFSVTAVIREWFTHNPSIAFRHLPPNSARFSYATEGALFISAQLSTDAVSALRKAVRVLIRLWSNLAPKHARKHEAHPPRVKKEFRLDSNDFGFI